MIIALDLETTWLDSTVDGIIEVALVKIDEKTFEKIDEFQTFVHPGVPIPELITNITNISDSDVEGAPSFSEIRQDIQEFIGDAPILGHNTNFDRKFLLDNGIDIEKNLVLDTFFLANFLLSDLKSLNLWFISDHLWISIESEHRAIYDTYATVDVFVALIEKLQSAWEQQLQIIRFIADRYKNPQLNYYLKTYLKNTKKLSQEKLVESLMKTIWENQEVLHTPTEIKNKSSDIQQIFESLEDFESRENQQKMAQIVFDTLTGSKKSVIEAPTWLWKTFAYLIPSIVFASQMWEQVYISTSTKTLQDQVFLKDLQYLTSALDIDFSYTKLKGKKNYVGLYGLFEYLDSNEAKENDASSFLLKILFWLLQTRSGEIDELDFYGEEYGFLRNITANIPYTFHTDNPYKEKEFIVQARNRAKKADIVVINNHLLFQDTASGGKILWPVKNLILDEAHSLEDVVTQSCKKWFSLRGLEKSLIESEKLLREAGESVSEFSLLRENLLFDLSTLFDSFSQYLYSKVDSRAKYKNILIQRDFFTSFESSNTLWAKILIHFQDLRSYIEELPEKTQLLLWRETWYFDEVQDIIYHIFSPLEVFETLIPTIQEREWYGIILEYTLLNPWSFLAETLWQKLDSVVLTSATLQIQESFDYISHMYYLNEFDFYVLKTDFDYSKQSLLFIPNDLGSIKYNLQQVFDFLREFLIRVGGNTLALFTAVSMVRDSYVAINSDLKAQGVNVLAQSVSGSKQKQIEAFKKSANNTVLFWTDALWQGVDIPWDNLKYLVIHKIPFMVPTDPVFQARSVLFDDAFREYSIPKSILKLKQWFGRLIRSKTDSWVVVFLDDRVFSTSWWEQYFSAFPEDIPVRISSSQNLFDVIEQ